MLPPKVALIPHPQSGLVIQFLPHTHTHSRQSTDAMSQSAAAPHVLYTRIASFPPNKGNLHVDDDDSASNGILVYSTRICIWLENIFIADVQMAEHPSYGIHQTHTHHIVLS